MTNTQPQTPVVNAWAILAVVFSIGVCPLATTIGFILGLVALKQSRRHPQMRGRRAAIVAPRSAIART